ncbi:hypothetical protein PFICI_04377 [Pestalotiopsis fici W106-1]|uniref:Protein kinase domain-containing protein n=1 Tax=Pestalotiopsis fici (strain W106-1 / CGMCC3.15140) TaxID=1229662 RepID=W3XBD1_PESFW|nr:uncharacterized protein PFICI_04377 [Pestalotiopsis fici W106-1]ETS82501.1 hypothetical protein PFICI_04377 [Pestalotiopsis fici W106-1]
MEQQRFSDIAVEVLSMIRDAYSKEHVHGVSHIDHKLLVQIILEIKATFKKIKKSLDKYSNTMDQPRSDVPDEVMRRGDDMLKALLLEPTSATETRATPSLVESNSLEKMRCRFLVVVRRLWTVARNPRRLVWVSIDKESIEALVQKLSDMNSYLVSLLDMTRAKRLEHNDQAKDTNILQVLRELRDVKAFIRAMSIDSGDNGTYEHLFATKSKSLQIAAELQKSSHEAKKSQLKKLAELKIGWMEAEQWEDEDLSSIKEEFQTMLLDISEFQFSTTRSSASLHGQRTIAFWHDRCVWVDWTQSSPNGEMFEERVAEREERIALLVRLLCNEIPASFRVLQCLGYIKNVDAHNSVSFGIVFSLPSHAKSQPKVMSLRQLMERQRMPPIPKRLSLSIALAQSLSGFHLVDWLHKSLNSDNIVFFEDDTGAFDLTRPYIAGFGISRPSDRVDMTEAPTCDPTSDIYRHPHAQFGEAKTVYRKSYDIYALGVIFTEIAVWKPIEATLGIGDIMAMTRDELRDIYRRLLKFAGGDGNSSEMRLSENETGQEEITDLTSICGSGHRDMIRVCLQARNVEKPKYRNEPPKSIHSRMQTMFAEQVERKLSMMQMELS